MSEDDLGSCSLADFYACYILVHLPQYASASHVEALLGIDYGTARRIFKRFERQGLVEQSGTYLVERDGRLFSVQGYTPTSDGQVYAMARLRQLESVLEKISGRSWPEGWRYKKPVIGFDDRENDNLTYAQLCVLVWLVVTGEATFLQLVGWSGLAPGTVDRALGSMRLAGWIRKRGNAYLLKPAGVRAAWSLLADVSSSLQVLADARQS